jgi:pimeloyl-ACP methyl ester carboxylesterase
MPYDTGFAEVNGARLYYEIQGTGQPLVLIHGNVLDHRMWDDQFAEFAQHYQVLRYDARGFGRSAVPTTAQYDHADDLRVLLRTLGLHHAAILGLSMGGRIAINFALAYPEAIDALIAADAGVDGYTFEAPLLADVITEARRSGVDAARTVWQAHPLLAPASEKPEVVKRLAEMTATYSGWHWLHADPQRIPSPSALQRLATMQAPALIVVGERDLSDFHRIAEILAQRIPRAARVVLPGVGHMPNMEAPAQFNNVVLNFLDHLKLANNQAGHRSNASGSVDRVP